MKVIIDSNILFSALLKPDGRIAEILLNPAFVMDKMTCHFLYVELFKHKEKLLKISKLPEDDLLQILYAVVKKVTFINEELIPDEIFETAKALVEDIDPKDAPFVALSLHLDAWLWSGDKKLMVGLHSKGFYKIISTEQLMTELSHNLVHPAFPFLTFQTKKTCRPTASTRSPPSPSTSS